jgi:spermidine synthase
LKFTHKQILTVSFFAFVLSGFSGLIYQSIWTRYLSLILGHAAFAQTLVLALFMGGMAFGAWWSSKLVSKHGVRVLRSYAVIEAIVGLAALVFHFIFVNGTDFFQLTILPSLGSEFSVGIIKWGWAALLILPQCILLGMTFPLLSAGLIRLSNNVTGEILGTLYFTNSIGAAVGALVATFILIPAVGLPGAIATAGILNLLAGLLVFIISVGEKVNDKKLPTNINSDAKASEHTRLILWCAFFTGLSSFVYEVAWVRMLALALGSTVHAFEIMISSFVAGLACGSFWIRKRIDRQTQPLIIAGWAQLLMGLAALSTIFSYKYSFYGVTVLQSALAPTASGYGLFNIASAAIAILLMFPTAFFAGMTLPVFTSALLRSGAAEHAIGKIYAVNTVGAIFGVFIAVHLLLPFLGMKSAILIAALIDIVLGIMIFHRMGNLQKHIYRFAAGIGMLAIVATGFSPKLDESILTSGVFRRGRGLPTEIVYYRDGKTASISAFFTGTSLAIATNGKVDAAVEFDQRKPPAADEETMAFAGLLPMVYLPEAASGAVIGFGSGVTTHTLLGNSKLKSLDTVEIEPAIIDAARAFGNRTPRAYQDSRSNIVFADAKTFFAGGNKRYDFIVSEPSNPWVSGVASLFSEEFYRFIPRHLNENGIFIQWIQLYEIDFTLVASILKALGKHFADYDMYITSGNDLIIVAKPTGKLPLKSGSLLSSPALVAELRRQGLSTLSDINLRYVINKTHFAPMVDVIPIAENSDYYPIVSHIAPKNRFTGAAARELAELHHTKLPYAELLSPDKKLPFSIGNANGRITSPKVLEQETAIAAGDVLTKKLSLSTITDERTRQNVAIINLAKNNCSSRQADQTTLAALIKISSLIATALPKDIATGYLKSNLLECAREILPSHFNLTHDFLLAVAKRDLGEIDTFGRSVLSHPELKQNSAIAEMALCAVAIALIQKGKPAEAAQLMETYKDVPFSPETRTLRTMLASIVVQRAP